MRDVTVGGCLGYSVHEMAEFRIFIVKTKKDGRVASLDLMRANFMLFRELLSRVSWESAFKDFGVHVLASI